MRKYLLLWYYNTEIPIGITKYSDKVVLKKKLLQGQVGLCKQVLEI